MVSPCTTRSTNNLGAPASMRQRFYYDLDTAAAAKFAVTVAPGRSCIQTYVEAPSPLH